MPSTNADLPFFSPPENQTWREMRGWLLPDAARLLHRHALEVSPDGTVVEIGSFAGKSTVCIARGLQDAARGPKFTAIDINFRPEFSANLEAFGVRERVDTIQSPSLAAADDWREPIAFLYIDAHHGKAHAFGDFLAWESLVLPGGVVALDDTAGLMLGPYLAVQAAIRSGAYELLPGAGGISFMRKKRSVVPEIGDYPMQPGSLVAYVNYVSSWIGAMDPDLRLPARAHSRPAPRPASADKRAGLVDRIMDTSPRSAARFLARKLRGPGASGSQAAVTESAPAPSREELLRDPLGHREERPIDVLEWLESGERLSPEALSTVSYLRGCFEMQCSRPAPAIEALGPLRRSDAMLLHYDLGVGSMASLRLAQALDLSGDRAGATATYGELSKECSIPEIQRQAEIGLARPFRLTEPAHDRLLREYVLDSPFFRYAKYH